MQFFLALVSLLAFLLLKVFLFGSRTHIKSLLGKHVAITSASSGIGFALAKRCVSEGAFVTLIDSTEKSLAKACCALLETVGGQSDRILLKEADVSDAAAASRAITESFRWRPIDILICDAGLGKVGHIDVVNGDEMEMVTKISLLGCLFPVRAALPLMKRRSMENPSSIVFIGSLSGSLLTSGMDSYTPTKYALKGLAELLRIELVSNKICVHLACPGFTDTPMLGKADKVEFTSELLSKLFFYNRAYESPDEIAEATLDGVKKGEFWITTSFSGFLVGVLVRGGIPAESVARAIVEFILLVPMRIASFIWFLNMRRLHQKQLEENLEKQKRQETVYNHSVADSAGDDDPDLYLCH